MKKSYITPDLKTIRLCSAMHLMEGSETIGIDRNVNVDDSDKSRAYERNSMLWEEDE